MTFPPQFEEKLHPRGHGGKFTNKPDVLKTPRVPGNKPGPPTPKPAAKAPAAPKPPKPKPKRVRYNAATAAPRLQRAAAERRAAGFNRAARVAPSRRPTQAHHGSPGPRFEMTEIGRQPDGSIDYEERARYIDPKLTQWMADRFDTQTLYRDQATGEWTPERLAQQEQLLEDIWYAHAANVPNQGRAIFSGGLGGAGKGYALRQAEISTDADWDKPGQEHEFFTINADTIKAMMAQRGMIPLHVDPKLTPMELSPLAHEEASELADRLAERAYAERKNVVWDFTMASDNSVLNKRLKPMREAGYDQVTALFVDTTVERSIQQATKRWRNGMNRFLAGEGEGGRFLPSGATHANKPQGDEFRSKNREVFERVKGEFDGYVVKENLDGDMRQVDESGIPLGGKGVKRRARSADDLDVDAMTKELGGRFNIAEPWMRETGADWYPGSGEWVDYAVEGTDFTPAQGAAIVAAFSPNTPWDRNLVLALNFIKGKPLGKDDGQGTLTENINRANRVKNMIDIDGKPVKDPIHALPGKDKEGSYKITNFYRNITGNQEAVTVDRWAVRAALGVDDATAAKILGWKGAYAKIGDAYRRAAKEAGITPAAMQAIVWGQVRGSFN